MRGVWDAIQYVAQSGCPWRLLPTDFPPVSTAQYHFYRLRNEGLFDLINDTPTMASRVLAGRDAAPTAGIIDSQSVKTTEWRAARLRHGQENKGAKAAHRDRHRWEYA